MIIEATKTERRTEYRDYIYKQNVEIAADVFLLIESGQHPEYNNIEEWLNEQDIDWYCDGAYDTDLIEDELEDYEISDEYTIEYDDRQDLLELAFLTNQKALYAMLKKNDCIDQEDVRLTLKQEIDV